MKLRAWVGLALVLLSAVRAHAWPQIFVNMDGSNLPAAIQSLPKAMAKIVPISRNPLRDSQPGGRRHGSPGTVPGQGTAWHLGHGVLVTAGHVIAEINGADQDLPFDPIGDVPLWATFQWGQNNLNAIPLFTDRRTYARANGFTEGAGGVFYRMVTPTETVVKYAVSNLRDPSVEADLAMLQLPAPWPEAALPLADGTEGVAVGDEVWIAGYPGSSDRPQERSGLYVDQARVASILDGGRWYVLDRAAGGGFSGGPLIHAKTGKVIGVNLVEIIHGQASPGVTAPVGKRVLYAQSVQALKLRERLAIVTTAPPCVTETVIP